MDPAAQTGQALLHPGEFFHGDEFTRADLGNVVDLGLRQGATA